MSTDAGDDVPLTDYNGCDQGIKCPIKVGDKNTFLTTINMEDDFPTVYNTLFLVFDTNLRSHSISSIPICKSYVHHLVQQLGMK